MKKQICLVMAMILCFGFAACGTERNLTDTSVGRENDAKATEGAAASVEKNNGTDASNILIAYFSVPEDIETVDTISQLQPGALMTGNELVLSRDDVADSEETVIEWAKSLGINTTAELPSNDAENTVANAAADASESQTLYLWEEGNMPATTEYTQNNGNYSDDPDFRPYLVSFPVPEGTKVKGAVLICAGGAFQFRSDEMEGTQVAQELAKRGYQSFVVNYRLRPYTQEEGALDLARAVRFVRKNAEVYGIDEKNIAVMG